MDYHIIHGRTMLVIPLNLAVSNVPDLDGAVLAAGDHPFALAVERDARDVVGVAFELLGCLWVCGLDVEEFDAVFAGGG